MVLALIKCLRFLLLWDPALIGNISFTEAYFNCHLKVSLGIGK